MFRLHFLQKNEEPRYVTPQKYTFFVKKMHSLETNCTTRADTFAGTALNANFRIN